MNINDYKLVWEENFDYEGPLNPEKWNYETGNFQWPNRELQAYSDRPGNVYVKDGVLSIRSLKEQDGEREYTSGKINTRGKASWKYGYFEFRAKIATGLGAWPAIWMMPQMEFPKMPDWVPRTPSGRVDFQKLTDEQRAMLPPIPEDMRWPNCGEIDIMEHVGRFENHLLFSLHCKNHNHANKNTVPYTRRVVFEENLYEDFHVYSMEWTEDYTEYFVDGKSYCRYNKSDKSAKETRRCDYDYCKNNQNS